MSYACSLRHYVEGKHSACAPVLNNDSNGIMRNWIDRIHPVSTRQTILDKFKIDKPLLHPEDFFAPVINYFTNLLTDFQTTAEKYNSLNNKKIQPLSRAPLIACISEVAPPPVYDTTTQQVYTEDIEDYDTDQVLLRDYPSLNKETLLFFIENTYGTDPVIDYHDFVEDILETIAEGHLCTIEALPEPS